MKFNFIFFLLLVNLLTFSFSNSQTTVEKSQLQLTNGLFMIKGNKTPFTGIASNGKDREFYKNGKPDGKWLTFYKDGSLKSIENWKNGLLNGKHIIYANGEVKIVEYRYENGHENGLYILNHGNGKPYIVGEFSKGAPSGVWKYYDKNGNLTGQNDFSKKKKKKN